MDEAEAARRLSHRYRLSERQAWRYVEQARDQGPVEVPSPKVVFTVKLPVDLLVAQALKEFLDRLGARSRDGR
jgi:DNA-binding transcriptional regulator LsrR (DeoR family)